MEEHATPAAGLREPARLGRRERAIILGFYGTLLAVVALIAFGFWFSTTQPKLTTLTVPMTGLDRPVHLLVVADLHSKRFGEGQGRIARLLDGRTYDTAVMLGDMAGRDIGLGLGGEDLDPYPGWELLDIVDDVTDGPIVTVPGNHDDVRFQQGLIDRGAIMLGDCLDMTDKTDLTTSLPLQGTDLSLAGPLEHFGELAATSPTFTAQFDAAKPVVILIHAPPEREQLSFARAVPASDRLVLAGHVHGGQIRLPVIGGLWAPAMDNDLGRFLPDHTGHPTEGLYTDGGVRILVTAGLGSTHLPVRFGTRAELLDLTLVPAPADAGAAPGAD